MTQKKIILKHKRAPGDTLVLTALVRDIALTYGSEFAIDVNTSAMSLWRYNPHVTRMGPSTPDVEQFEISYGKGLREQNTETVHFLPYFHRAFNEKCGTDVQLKFPWPDYHLSTKEKEPIFKERYWVVISGGKTDFTAKVWETRKFQGVVDQLRRYGITCVQAGSNGNGHWHPPLHGAVDMVGQTNLRDLARLIYHADGVICGVTCAMHMAAALRRPCVVLAGGREAWWWEAYVNENNGFGPEASGNLQVPHRFLHTIGLLDCCENHGCWRNKVVALNKDKSLCKRPITTRKQPVPLCMDLISVENVVESVMSYYTDKTLPPISPSEIHLTPTIKYDVFADLGGLAHSTPTFAQTGALEKKPSTKKAATTPHGGADSIHRMELSLATINHKHVGGKFTVFVNIEGADFAQHRKCLESVLTTIPRDCRDLRVASTIPVTATREYIDGLVKSGDISKHYTFLRNTSKYTLMREMLHDASYEIQTKYFIWADSSTTFDKDSNWVYYLSRLIAENHDDNCRMYGPVYVWSLKNGQADWIKNASWYRDKLFKTTQGDEVANGNTIHFINGAFWAMETDAMRKCNVPDPEIRDNKGGDYIVGEQLHQHGYALKSFDSGRRRFVNWGVHMQPTRQGKHVGCG